MINIQLVLLNFLFLHVFLQKLYNYIFKDEDRFVENEKLYNNIKEILDKYYREYGLSIDDFILLEKGLAIKTKS